MYCVWTCWWKFPCLRIFNFQYEHLLGNLLYCTLLDLCCSSSWKLTYLYIDNFQHCKLFVYKNGKLMEISYFLAVLFLVCTSPSQVRIIIMYLHSDSTIITVTVTTVTHIMMSCICLIITVLPCMQNHNLISTCMDRTYQLVQNF